MTTTELRAWLEAEMREAQDQQRWASEPDLSWWEGRESALERALDKLSEVAEATCTMPETTERDS